MPVIKPKSFSGGYHVIQPPSAQPESALPIVGEVGSNDYIRVLDISDSDPNGSPKLIPVSAFKSSLDADKHYTTSFANQTSLRITHNLGKRPEVTILDTGGNSWKPVCNYESAGDPLNKVDVSWNGTTSGRAICN
jgi:hypothetical protein